MPIPAALQKGLKLPVIAAPMFLVSGPELVIASCKAGIVGTFPALNQRSTAGYVEWLDEIEGALGPDDAAYGVNLIVHHTNGRLQDDLKASVDKRVPLIITSLGAVKEVVDAVHSYGGLVFHDVTNTKHALKAAEAGVDGLILVAAGAGGHAGTWSPFALVNEIRQFFKGAICLSGCLSTGRDVATSIMMGADFAYMGTRFIATSESRAPGDYKDMIVDSGASDTTYTPAISGIPANFLTKSLIANGLDPKQMSFAKEKIDLGAELNSEAKAWKTVWSAGQGVTAIHDPNPTTAELVARLTDEFQAAGREFAGRYL